MSSTFTAFSNIAWNSFPTYFAFGSTTGTGTTFSGPRSLSDDMEVDPDFVIVDLGFQPDEPMEIDELALEPMEVDHNLDTTPDSVRAERVYKGLQQSHREARETCLAAQSLVGCPFGQATVDRDWASPPARPTSFQIPPAGNPSEFSNDMPRYYAAGGHIPASRLIPPPPAKKAVRGGLPRYKTPPEISALRARHCRASPSVFSTHSSGARTSESESDTAVSQSYESAPPQGLLRPPQLRLSQNLDHSLKLGTRPLASSLARLYTRDVPRPQWLTWLRI
ncbi:unnamed protein product [Mycena citricolor]|uniref:Uncharacterized protein n=1 Tax=Mycena citricolor TaxID=2018698 RepID=A0AAD2HH32_9AGAR|nr:unnamed protein product [Mycena citricolor]CAK5276566.1 unnamed protein product [Mycena citricolor]